MGSGGTIRTCSACGAPSSPFNIHCPRCGAALASASDPARTEELTASGEGRSEGIDPLAMTMPVDPAAPDPGVRPGALLGRFEVIERLGQGAMGEVVRARDPTLGREVAIKVLRPSARGSNVRARARLVREAQAMARIKHPNVVTVHEVDASGPEVLVVMECVEGRTLRAFCEERGRKALDVLAAFVQAGRGLCEVHRAGLVHRDFKPENVLVGADGWVRVTDFGLVGPAEEGGWAPPLDDAGHPILLTRSGALLGTPAYMAPEQHAREPVDARADQFSFCAALWEALAGERPFAGETYDELRENVRAGRLREPPRAAGMPAWIRRVLARGLSVARARRYPDMEALLAALGRDPSAARRRALVFAGVLAGVGLAAFALWRRSSAALCHGGEARLAGVWGGATKASVRAAFAATGKPYADDTYRRVERALDERARAWAAMYTDSCEATHARGEQSAALLDLRTGCLERRRREMGALTALFARGPDGEVLDRAPSAALALPGLEACGDAAALTAAIPPPADAAARAQVDGLRGRLAEIEALDGAGKYQDALALAVPLAGEARATGYAPVEAEALLALGQVQRDAHDLPGAEATLREAAPAAARAKDDARAAEAWTVLVYVIGYLGERFADALALRLAAEGAVERGGNDPLARARLSGTLGSILDLQGKYAEAEDLVRQEIGLLDETRPRDRPHVATALNTLGNVLVHRERFDEAERAYGRAIALREQLFGPDHPAVATTLNNVGRVLNSQGREREAIPYLERAISIQERSLGPEHPYLAVSLSNLGIALNVTGQSGRALEVHRRVLSIRDKALGPDHPDVATTLNNLGIILETQSKPALAEPYYARALGIREKALGPDHAEVASTLANLARVLAAQKRYTEAVPRLERAIAIREKAVGPRSIGVAVALTELADVYLEMGKPSLALPLLERALAIYGEKSRGVHPFNLADARFDAARALWGAGGDRRRAVDLAIQARDVYASSPSEYAQHVLVLVKDWLASHGVK